jgi:exonuclease III
MLAANKSFTRQTYNTLAKELKHLLKNLKNEGIQDNLKGLTPPEVKDYSLWKTTRKMERPEHHIPPLRLNHNT